MKYELTIVDRRGQVAVRLVDAASASDASLTCHGGERVLACVKRLDASLGGWGRRKALLDFCEALEQVLSGGLTLSQSLQALAADGDSKGASMASAVLRELSTGRAPSDAFAATGLGWTAFLIALIRSAERTGQIAPAIRRFVQFERATLGVRSRLVSASIYPLVLLSVSAVVLLFLLGFVVPKFALALDDLHTEVPGASRFILDTGLWLSAHGPTLILPLLCAAVALCVVAWEPNFRAAIQRSLAGLPGVRSAVELSGRAQAMRVSAALLAGGETLPVAFSVARSTASSLIADKLDAALKRVERGEPPSRALKDSGLAGPVSVQLLTAAERTGGLAECFERLARSDEDKLARLLDRFTSAWGPVLLVGVALIVGGVVVALYLPLLQIFESVQ